jgi:hypothetical protein
MVVTVRYFTVNITYVTEIWCNTLHILFTDYCIVLGGYQKTSLIYHFRYG